MPHVRKPSPELYLDLVLAGFVAAQEDELRPEERDLIVGRLELELSYEELAQAVGRPTANAARSAVVRAMIRLAEEMGHE